jgi:hypothetical protein
VCTKKNDRGESQYQKGCVVQAPTTTYCSSSFAAFNKKTAIKINKLAQQVII